MSRQDITFNSGGQRCAAWLYLPDGADGPGPVRRHGARLRGHARGRDPRVRRALRGRRAGRVRVRLPPLRRQRGRAPPAARHRPAARRLDGRDRMRAHARGGRRDAHRAVGLVVLGRPCGSDGRARRPGPGRDLAGAVLRRAAADRLVLPGPEPEDHAARAARPARRPARPPAALLAGDRAARLGCAPAVARVRARLHRDRARAARAGATSARRA